MANHRYDAVRLTRTIDLMLAGHDAGMEKLGRQYDELEKKNERYLDLFRAIAENDEARAAINGELRAALRPVIDLDEYEQ